MAVRQTTEPNCALKPIHEKAMPVLIRTEDEAEQWLEAPPEEALRLQKTAADDAIVLPPDKKEAARCQGCRGGRNEMRMAVSPTMHQLAIRT